ncbi:MAG: family 43 glycosylhydrolase [Planctomycetes bacterium]|nr:family 43 glycosylhydrolase [Planctomycetota bacterium]
MSCSLRTSPYGDIRLGAFQEVLSIPGRYLNDHCLIRKGDEWHFFGILGNVGPDGKGYAPGSEISFAHAVSPNLRNWQLHSEVIERTGIWPETYQVFAPYVIEHDGMFYMLYTAADDMHTQRICLAMSEDLYQWERYAGNPVIVPSMFWTKWPGFNLDPKDPRGTYGGCRDPHIIKLDDGRFVAYWASRLQERFGKDLSCIAASVSYDLIHWQEIGPVFSIKAWDDPPTQEAESPCIVVKDSRFWLFFKHGWCTHFVVADSPFDFHGCEPVRLGFSHASEVFYWDGKWWITHCSGDPDDFMYCKSNRTRGLFIGNLDWPDKEYPQLIGPN